LDYGTLHAKQNGGQTEYEFAKLSTVLIKYILSIVVFMIF